jgi:hypothetical protein
VAERTCATRKHQSPSRPWARIATTAIGLGVVEVGSREGRDHHLDARCDALPLTRILPHQSSALVIGQRA